MTTKFTTYSTNGKAHKVDLFAIEDPNLAVEDVNTPVQAQANRPWRLLRRTLIALLTLLSVAILYLLVVALTDGLKPGTPAPDFAGTTLQGETVRLSDYHGQPLMLVFWSPECSACREELPAIQAIADDPQRQAAMVTVVSYVDTAEVAAFAKANDLHFPVISDESGQISQHYNVHGIPYTYLINPNGLIDSSVVGSGGQTSLSGKLAAWMSTCDVQEVCK